MRKILLAFFIVLIPFSLGSTARAIEVYTFNYAADFANAAFPGFGGLPSNIFVEGRYTFENVGPIFTNTADTIALYSILTHDVRVNGTPVTVQPAHYTIQVENDSAPEGNGGDGYSTFVNVGSNNEIAPGIFLTVVSPRFFDTSPNPTALSSTDLPLSVAALSGFEDPFLLINYRNGNSFFGNSAPFSRFEFTQMSPIPVPAALPLFLTAISVLGFIFCRSR